MSDFVDKTIGTFTNLFSNVGLLNANDSKTRLRPTYGFDKSQFLTKLQQVKSKKEEEIVVNNCLTAAEKLLSEPNVTESQIQNIVQLALCCESLGYKAPFVYVHAIKLAQRGNLSQKNTGYLACASFLQPDHELTILLINSIQKDLESPNPHEVMLGLRSVCNFVNSETVHNVFHIVLEKLTHHNFEVRKLATFAVDVCLQRAGTESAFVMALPKLERVLSDSDLSVVAAVVPVMYNVVKHCPGDYSYLIECLIQIQIQLLQRRSPRHKDYHGIPAPWLQIKIIQFFSLLCHNTKHIMDVFPVLKATLEKAELNHSIAYAIVAEVIECIATIASTEEMIQLALSVATKFLNSEDGNLKYVGVQAFTGIVRKVKPLLDVTHQESIMACLNHPDDTLNCKTLELLYALANPSNANAVCKKLTEFMVTKADISSKKDLGLKVLEIANQYNVESEWYMSTVNSVLSELGDVIPNSNICEVIRIIQQESSGSLKRIAKDVYLKMCQNICPPSSIIKIMCSIFNQMSEFESVAARILVEADELGCLWLLVALRNQFLVEKNYSMSLQGILVDKTFTSNTLKQVQSELLNLMKTSEILQNVQFTDMIDPTLSFLDEVVSEGLLQGKSCYKTYRLRSNEFNNEVVALANSLSPSSIDKYSFMQESTNVKSFSNPMTLSYGSLSSSSLSTLSQEVPYVNPKKRSVWTKDGRCKEDSGQSAQETQDPKVTADQELFAGLQ